MPKRKESSDESDDYDDDSSEENEKVEIRKPKIERIDKFKNLKKIIMNVSMTQYSVVSEVAEDLNWKIQSSIQSGDWDIFWTDFNIDPDILIRMHLFQKINHFPGIHVIARKNLLGLNLTNMRHHYPQEYNFFPLTWMLPQQYAQFREFFQTKPKGKTRTYIVKPEADCQGRGIFLTRKLEDLENGKHYVVQRYIARPYLLDGLKFDLRIYVLLCGTNPLTLYMYNEGLARLATETYTDPTNHNLDKLCMHLTNYAINKHNPKFIFNNNSANMGVGHKRSLSCVFKQLANKGLDVDTLKKKIKDIIIKTVITGLPSISHQYKCSQPEDYSGNMCFHILGLDVMVNNKGDPFVIEVNHTPSFATETPLDHKIKYNLIKDTLVLMNINVKKKNQLYNRSKKYNTERLLTGKRHIFEGQDRENKIKEAQQERHRYERQHLGDYQRIFPLDDPELQQKYQNMIQTSINQYYQENQSIRNRRQQKEMKKMYKSDIKTMKKNEQVRNKPGKSHHTTIENTSKVSDLAVSLKVQENEQKNTKNEEIKSEIQDEKKKQIKSPELKSNPTVKAKQTPLFSIHKQRKTPQKIRQGKNMTQSQKVQQEKNVQKKFNRFKRQIRESNHTADKREKSEQLIASEKSRHPGQQFKTSKNICSFEPRKTTSNNDGQLPNIIDSHNVPHPFSELFHRSQYQNTKRVEAGSNGRFVVQSEPKVGRMRQNIQKQIKLLNEKRGLLTGNGGYVMPKIFYLNKQDKMKQEEINLLTAGKKIQGSFNKNQ